MVQQIRHRVGWYWSHPGSSRTHSSGKPLWYRPWDRYDTVQIGPLSYLWILQSALLQYIPPPPTTTRFQYRRIAEIPLRKTYPKDANNPIPPWFPPETVGILPDDVRLHARIHDALAMEHDYPKTQAHLHQMTQHLEALDLLIAELYIIHTSTTPSTFQNYIIFFF